MGIGGVRRNCSEGDQRHRWQQRDHAASMIDWVEGHGRFRIVISLYFDDFFFLKGGKTLLFLSDPSIVLSLCLDCHDRRRVICFLRTFAVVMLRGVLVLPYQLWRSQLGFYQGGHPRVVLCFYFVPS